MTAHFNSGQDRGIAGKIIGNAMELPLENQELLLMMAKAMQYTHNCMLHQKTGRPSSGSETDT